MVGGRGPLSPPPPYPSLRVPLTYPKTRRAETIEHEVPKLQMQPLSSPHLVL